MLTVSFSMEVYKLVGFVYSQITRATKKTEGKSAQRQQNTVTYIYTFCTTDQQFVSSNTASVHILSALNNFSLSC